MTIHEHPWATKGPTAIGGGLGRGKLGKDTVDGRNPAPPKGWLKPYK